MRGRSDSSSAAQGGRPGGGGGAGGPPEALRSSAERDRDVPADSLRTSAGAFEPSGRSREAERWCSEDAQPAGSSSARQSRQPSGDAAGERAPRRLGPGAGPVGGRAAGLRAARCSTVGLLARAGRLGSLADGRPGAALRALLRTLYGTLRHARTGVSAVISDVARGCSVLLGAVRALAGSIP